MRYFLLIFLLCALAFSASFNGPAYSQRHSGYCDQAESTAGALDCINRHNRDTQAKLSETFKTIIAEQDETNRPLLSDAQKNWILYRDAQCAWEAGLTDSPSLERVYQLSCLTALTERRIDLLKAVQARELAPAPREFSSQPRWMNVLANDYPNIFWRYGDWKSADMDCDGDDEQVMSGITVSHIQKPAYKPGSGAATQTSPEATVSQKVEIVISISENPLTGRPKTSLIRLPVATKKFDGPHVCRPSARLELKERPIDKAGEDTGSASEQAAAEGQSCKSIYLADGICDPVAVIWNGESYEVQTAGASGGTL